ncbi:MAG TPA: tRNA pseudouridine(13) synthase TruD [Phycisphaerales bacterium]|nr:tRNA pseudouridine(13) synthase TruD [Phycisphaerales bacterium]
MTIRKAPSEFIVEERIGDAFREALAEKHDIAHTNATFELRKVSLTTPDAARLLARELGASPGAVSYAGLKDRHAETVQWMTVESRAIRSEPKEVIEGHNWAARLVGWSPRAILAEAIDGNRFTIVVRNLSKETSAEMDRRVSLLRDESGALLIVNYFGAQRFGSARHGKGFAGPALIRGDFEAALRLLIATPARKDSGKTRAITRAAATHWGKWEKLLAEMPSSPERRAIDALASGGSFKEAFCLLPAITQQMAVEAYQSLLWNQAARRIADQIAATSGSGARSGDRKGTPAILKSPDDFGEMRFPIAQAVAATWRDIQLPLFAKGTELREPWKRAAEETLRTEGITVGDLRIPGLKKPYFGEAMRPLFARADHFELSKPEKDETSKSDRCKRLLTFDLPRGAYATVVLRALGQ